MGLWPLLGVLLRADTVVLGRMTGLVVWLARRCLLDLLLRSVGLMLRQLLPVGRGIRINALTPYRCGILYETAILLAGWCGRFRGGCWGMRRFARWGGRDGRLIWASEFVAGDKGVTHCLFRRPSFDWIKF